MHLHIPTRYLVFITGDKWSQVYQNFKQLPRYPHFFFVCVLDQAPTAPIIMDMILVFMFHIFLRSQAKSWYSPPLQPFFKPLFIFSLHSMGIATSTIWQTLFSFFPLLLLSFRISRVWWISQKINWQQVSSRSNDNTLSMGLGFTNTTATQFSGGSVFVTRYSY